MGEAAELSAQLGGRGRMGMNAPGIDNRQMALNIMHWLSRQLEFYPSAPVATAYLRPCAGVAPPFAGRFARPRGSR